MQWERRRRARRGKGGRGSGSGDPGDGPGSHGDGPGSPLPPAPPPPAPPLAPPAPPRPPAKALSEATFVDIAQALTVLVVPIHHGLHIAAVAIQNQDIRDARADQRVAHVEDELAEDFGAHRESARADCHVVL